MTSGEYEDVIRGHLTYFPSIGNAPPIYLPFARRGQFAAGTRTPPFDTT